MKTLFFAATLALSLPALSQDAKPLSPTKIPLRADAPILFAPRGWTIEKTISGDLNRDKIADCALVLVEQKPLKDDADNPTPRQRALVVLLKEGKGWHRVGFNNSLLLGTRDGGAFFGIVETLVEVSIAKSVLIIAQESGSRDVLDTTHKFRFDARKSGVFLIGFDSIDRDRLDTSVHSLSANYLTGIQHRDEMKGDSEKITRKTTRVSRKLRTLESVQVAERYAGQR